MPIPNRRAMGQELEEQVAPPVILRWQDLGELPEGERIIKAPEDYTPPRGKGKGKGKGKENKGKGNQGKVKAQVSDDKEGPPLANYIKLSEYSFACKMCPNPDWHRTVHCPNLTPALKERLKVARSSSRTKAFHPDDMACHICLKTTDHWSSECSYLLEYPRGAIVGRFAQIICLCCGEEMPHPGVPGLDWKARVILKPAVTYPSIKEQLMALTLASEGAADGTGNNASTSEGAAYGTGIKASG